MGVGENMGEKLFKHNRSVTECEDARMSSRQATDLSGSPKYMLLVYSAANGWKDYVAVTDIGNIQRSPAEVPIPLDTRLFQMVQMSEEHDEDFRKRVTENLEGYHRKNPEDLDFIMLIQHARQADLLDGINIMHDCARPARGYSSVRIPYDRI